ncbi:metalloprotease ATP23 [Artomyces pyxidatus]|uniref:Metalloprotease ATP23 n=1 Tax=Artomyces pyxidatus TaxID=48021 RepID=A0ACB8SU94_9AGAM|nr:metalloprotease ATP23 [Artomyces pyxidatus]
MSAADASTPSTTSTPSSDNKLFRRWRREFSLLTGYGIPSDERVHEIGRRNCEKWKKELLNYSPSVVFMMKHLQLQGANVKPEHLPCVPCDLTRSGGFYPEMGAVVLCQGNFLNKKHMEHTMVHELVHMYDHVKFKVDWTNLRHHACSEIRANSLSGDCSWMREMQRGKISFSKQHQACVRRRAVMSVMANPSCPDEASAERAVNEVWESCFNDTRPFDEASVHRVIYL